MQDEIKNSYDLFELFKAHSRTTSCGVLSIRWDNNDISVIMNEGKIIGVDSPSNRLTKLILDRSGLTDEEIKSLPKGSIFNKSYQTALFNNVGILPHELEKVQRSVENEELQKLKSFTEGSFEFNLSIPDNERNYLLNIPPGQFSLDLVQNGFRISIFEEAEDEQQEEITIKEKDLKPQVSEKQERKSKETIRPDYHPNTKSFIRLVNYHSLTQEGEKAVYFLTGLCLALFCGWKMPVMFSELITSISELIKI